MIGALEVRPDGSAGALHLAHLIPEIRRESTGLIMNPEEPRRLHINFLSFIAALEEEFSKKQKYRKMEAAEKAILLARGKESAILCGSIAC